MALRTCMNILCGTTSCTEWKTGWSLRSGELANLCDKCGSTFERHVYCEEFHADDSGWRECVTCGKRLHCGCIASWSLIELLDGGGVKCIGCARNLGLESTSNDGKCNGSGPSTLLKNNDGIIKLANYEGSNGIHLPSLFPNAETVGLLKREESSLPLRENGSTYVTNSTQSPMALFQKDRLDISTINMQPKDIYETGVHPNLNITLGVPMGNLHHNSGAIIGDRDQRKMSNNAFHQGFMSSHLSPRPPKLATSPSSDHPNVSLIPSMRVARPPAEGRGRSQLLPRYWPRITEQELQQISGDSNCTIVPLFEKVLSASDAGRIGRLVLPKACAEAYFPHITQPEGLPIKIQDIKGKEWVFQFRFWPNNNSRMYVLEGVTPCIQSMQLQAGDTVTFSRIDPERKLVMGFRKASNCLPMQSMKGSTDLHMNALSRQLDPTGGSLRWPGGDKYDERTEEGILSTSTMMLDRKKSRNIGSKSKRLLIDSHDMLALRLTWEEVQGMLRPPQSATPSVVVVEEYEIEEYEEPPVFGKSSIFTARSSGVIEQWAQCDSCSKWRRLPGDILLPPKWTCSENAWDQTRCFCSAPDELGPKELETILQQNKDFKKRRMAMADKLLLGQESSGLESLAKAATSGDNTGVEPGSSAAATTTKHPRHRPGCSCIVCIQPPSGKGKHKSSCTCTVCMTVKRRFKTLMMRKKKKQEESADAALGKTKTHQPMQSHNKEEEDEGLGVALPVLRNPPEKQGHNKDDGEEAEYASLGVGPAHSSNDGMEDENNGKGLDLNCHPRREEELRAGSAQAASLRDLLQLASLPLEAYMNENGLRSLTSRETEGEHEQENPDDSELQKNDPS